MLTLSNFEHVSKLERKETFTKPMQISLHSSFFPFYGAVICLSVVRTIRKAFQISGLNIITTSSMSGRLRRAIVTEKRQIFTGRKKRLERIRILRNIRIFCLCQLKDCEELTFPNPQKLVSNIMPIGKIWLLW